MKKSQKPMPGSPFTESEHRRMAWFVILSFGLPILGVLFLIGGAIYFLPGYWKWLFISYLFGLGVGLWLGNWLADENGK